VPRWSVGFCVAITKKWPRQRARLALDGDLLLLHRFEQRALRLRPGAVDFVGQQHLREHRPGVEHEGLFVALVDADAVQVRRHQVGGELHAREAQPERHRERMRQRRLAHTGHVFDQQVPAGQHAGDAVFDLRAFANDDRANLVDELDQSLRESIPHGSELTRKTEGHVLNSSGSSRRFESR
jgi:hypothetical protein